MGKLTCVKDSLVVIGMGTKFLEQVEIGSSLKVPGQQTTPAVAKIISDTELEIKFAFEDSVENASFKIWPKLDHSQVYSRVWKRLAQGGSIGIFPEGGSHDNPHLLPLKAGVTVMVTFWMASFFFLLLILLLSYHPVPHTGSWRHGSESIFGGEDYPLWSQLLPWSPLSLSCHG